MGGERRKAGERHAEYCVQGDRKLRDLDAVGGLHGSWGWLSPESDSGGGSGLWFGC